MLTPRDIIQQLIYPDCLCRTKKVFAKVQGNFKGDQA